MSYDTLCLGRRRPFINIRHDCYYCVELDEIYRDCVCFPPMRNRKVSAECDITTIHPPHNPIPLWFSGRWRRGCGQGGYCLTLHCVYIRLQLRLDLPLALRQAHPSIILRVLHDTDSDLLGPPGPSPYLPTLSSESSP
jgi:hypothetical protein